MQTENDEGDKGDKSDGEETESKEVVTSKNNELQGVIKTSEESSSEANEESEGEKGSGGQHVTSDGLADKLENDPHIYMPR